MSPDWFLAPVSTAAGKCCKHDLKMNVPQMLACQWFAQEHCNFTKVFGGSEQQYYLLNQWCLTSSSSLELYMTQA